MIKVTTIGPNGISDGTFHIHAEGCRDIKQRKYHRSEKYNETITSVEQLVNDSYADIIDENPDTTWEDYADEFKIFPCVGDVPRLEADREIVVEEPKVETVIEEVEVEKLEIVKTSNYPLGKNQQYVLNQLGIHVEYFKGCDWIWYFHSSTVEVLESLEVRGLVTRYTHAETGMDIWNLSSAGEAVYNNIQEVAA